MTKPQNPPSISACAEVRDLELDFCAEQLSLLSVEVSIARGYVDLSNEAGFTYSVRLMKARMAAIVEAEGRIAELRRDRAIVEGPELAAQGQSAAALGEQALRAFWKGLSNAQQAAVDGMQRIAWKAAAKRADEERAARAEPKGVAA